MYSASWTSKPISRRAFLRTCGQASLLGVSGIAGRAAFASESVKESAESDSLGLAHLTGSDKTYGAAIRSEQIDDDDFVRAVKREVSLLVPETELRWDVVHPAPDHFDFDGYDRIADFAHGNDLDMRGHALIWHRGNPAWLERTLAACSPEAAEKIMRTHIQTVLAQTNGDIQNWDVVNEAFDPRSTRSDFLRETVWLKVMGPDYIAKAYHMAYDVDSNLTLVYNDFGLEYDDADARTKRHAVLHFLITCRKQQIPVHAVGLQSHLQCHRPLGGHEFATFLKDVRRLGLNVYVTELDVDTSQLTGTIMERESIAQQYVAAYLNLIEQQGALDTVLTWGLSDRYTWMKQYGQKGAGALPLDSNMKRGPLWDTLRTAWADS